MRDSRLSVVNPSASPGSNLVVIRQTESTCRSARLRVGGRCFLLGKREFPTTTSGNQQQFVRFPRQTGKPLSKGECAIRNHLLPGAPS
jgi:hypothetical protein